MSDAKLAKCAPADEAECHGVHLMMPSGTSRALTSRNRVFVFFVKLMAHSLSGWSGTNRWVDSRGAVVPLSDEGFRDQLEPDLGVAPADRSKDVVVERVIGRMGADGRQIQGGTEGERCRPRDKREPPCLASVLSLLQVPGGYNPTASPALRDRGRGAQRTTPARSVAATTDRKGYGEFAQAAEQGPDLVGARTTGPRK
jgi:hypothetical protein